METELNTNFERIRDEFFTGFHSIVEGQSGYPPFKAVQEEPETMNVNTEVNAHILKLFQDLQQQFATMYTNNNKINPPITKNIRKPPNATNTQNLHRRNTRNIVCHVNLDHISVWIAT